MTWLGYKCDGDGANSIKAAWHCKCQSVIFSVITSSKCKRQRVLKAWATASDAGHQGRALLIAATSNKFGSLEEKRQAEIIEGTVRGGEIHAVPLD